MQWVTLQNQSSTTNTTHRQRHGHVFKQQHNTDCPSWSLFTTRRAVSPAPEIESICDISIEPLPAAGKLLRKYAAMAVTNIFHSETSVTIYQSIRRNISKGEMFSKWMLQKKQQNSNTPTCYDTKLKLRSGIKWWQNKFSECLLLLLRLAQQPNADHGRLIF